MSGGLPPTIFFFGTLMDADVRRLVIGRDLASAQIEFAVIERFRRVHVAKRSYPMLVPHPTGRVAGALARDLDSDSLLRLVVYEGGEYGIVSTTVVDRLGRPRQARVFVAERDLRPDPRPWHLESWQRRHKRRFLRHVRGLMARYDAQAMLRGLRRKNPAILRRD